jgi:GGDEF-like domain/PucR C-terminal helix-turn-helix domain
MLVRQPQDCPLPDNSSPPRNTASLVRSLGHLRRTQEELFYQLSTAVEHQYGHEPEPAARVPGQRRREVVHKLLIEAYVSREEMDLLGYDLDAWHLGIIATGGRAARALEELRVRFGCELLLIVHGQRTWAWFGGSRQIKAVDLKRVLSRGGHREAPSFAIGEAGLGVDGWRLTHHQAREAHRVAVYEPKRFTWYADSPLLAAALRDETLAGSLEQKYLVPLRSQKDGGVVLRKTLRAYVDAACSATSAASAVGVGRHAVEGRIQTAEQLIGCAIRTCIAELDVALRMEEVDYHGVQLLDTSFDS